MGKKMLKFAYSLDVMLHRVRDNVCGGILGTN